MFVESAGLLFLSYYCSGQPVSAGIPVKDASIVLVLLCKQINPGVEESTVVSN